LAQGFGLLPLGDLSQLDYIQSLTFQKPSRQERDGLGVLPPMGTAASDRPGLKNRSGKSLSG
jgi:hypothetical protein